MRKKYRVGLLVIATGKYTTFLPQLIESVDKYFKAGKIFPFVFTNSPIKMNGVKVLYKKHQSFPYPTLTRYHTFWEYRKELSKMDHLFYCDADMKFVDFVGKEILGDLVGVRHPGYFNKPTNKFPYETNPKSTAYVKNGNNYYCGGFNGGSTKEFLKMSKTISKNIDVDLKNGIVAKFHDESHLNKYFQDNSPSLILNPSYCYPEGEKLPFKPKIIALQKNHAVVRYTGFLMYINSFKEILFDNLVHKPIMLVKKIL